MTRIELARCPAFRIGGLLVTPASREAAAEGGREVLEPRVMQVLVALAVPGGRVVSRDELIARCWDGRTVGDDAINRAIGRLRRLSESLPGEAFRIETIARVGYRLHAAPRARAEEADPPLAPPPPARRFRRWPAHARALLALIAVAGGATLAARTTTRDPAGRPAAALRASQDLETRAIAASFEGTPEQSRQAIGYLTQAMAISPGYADGWGSLALVYVCALPLAAPEEQADASRRAREAAAQALALDPRQGHAHAALAALEPTFGDWARKDAFLLRALETSTPDSPPLMFQRVQFLAAVGRVREASDLLERMGDVVALIPWVQAARIELMSATGRLGQAERLADHAGTLWPRDRLVWFTRFFREAFHGRPERALAMAEDTAEWPTGTDPAEIARARQAALAVAGRASPEEALRAYRDAAREDQTQAETGIRVASALGRPDQALAFARLLYTTSVPRRSPGVVMPVLGYLRPEERHLTPLFLPPAESLRADPGFMPLMTELGLADYWRGARLPDLCDGPPAAAACDALKQHPRPLAESAPKPT